MLLLSVVLPVMIHSRMSFVLNYHKVGGVCQFNYFMGTLLRERQADLYRSKGVLSIEGQGDTKFVFQVTPAGANQEARVGATRHSHGPHSSWTSFLLGLIPQISRSHRPFYYWDW